MDAYNLLEDSYTLLFEVVEDSSCDSWDLECEVLSGVHSPIGESAQDNSSKSSQNKHRDRLKWIPRIYILSKYSPDIQWIRRILGGRVPPLPPWKPWMVLELKDDLARGDIAVIFNAHLNDVFANFPYNRENDEPLQTLGDSLARHLESWAVSQMGIFKSPHKIFSRKKIFPLPSPVSELFEDLIRTATLRSISHRGRTYLGTLRGIALTGISLVVLVTIQGILDLFEPENILFYTMFYIFFFISSTLVIYIFLDFLVIRICKVLRLRNFRLKWLWWTLKRGSLFVYVFWLLRMFLEYFRKQGA